MKNWTLVTTCFLLCLFQVKILLSQNSITTENESILQDSVFSLEAITVHAFQYETRLLEIPGAISIISSNELEQNALQSIDFVLNQIPGVYMQSASLTTNRLTIRGIGSRSPYASNKIRAYYAGIPLTNGIGETSIEDLNQSILSKVEIIKGPASGFYGSGLGGTLLFEAIHPSQNLFSVDYGLSSFQSNEINSKLELVGKNSNNQFAIERLSSEGYRENNQTDRLNLNYIGQFETEKHKFNLIINHTDLKAFIPSSLDWETFNNSPRKAASNWAATQGFEDYKKSLVGVSMSSNWENNWTSTASLFGQLRNSEELRPFNLLEENSHYFGGRFLVEKTVKTDNASWKYTLGNESFFEAYNWSTFENEERIKGEILSNNQEYRNYLNVFGQVDYLFSKRLRISASANINKTNYRYTDLFLNDGDQSGNHAFKTMLSPRLAINYSLNQKQRFYGQISHGFSPPSLEETLLPEGGRNTDIQPETGWNYEIGSRGYLFEELFYDVSAYFMSINNLLVAKRVDEDAYLGINAGKTAHPGLEYYLRYRLPASTNWHHQLGVNGNFAPYYFVDFVDGDADYSGNELTGTPRHQNNFSYQLQIKQQFDIQLHYNRVGRIPLRDDNSIYADRYGLLNTNFQYKKTWGQIMMKVMVAVNNLTNEHYSSMVLINASSFGSNQARYYYPGMPLNFSFRIKMAYQF